MAYSASQFILSATNFSENVKIAATCKSSGAGRICFLVTAQADPLNGYLFKFSAIQGEEPGQILRIDSGAATDISTYKTGRTNASQLTGPHSVAISHYFGTRSWQITVDGKLVATAKDSTYTVDGPVGYGAEVVVGEILDLKINGHEEILTTSPSIPSVAGLTATVTKKADLLLVWTPLSPLPSGFSDYEIRSGASWAAGTFVGKTKQAQYLVTDPPEGEVTYWVGVMDLAGFYDASPPSVTGSVGGGFSQISNVTAVFPSAMPDSTGLYALADVIS